MIYSRYNKKARPCLFRGGGELGRDAKRTYAFLQIAPCIIPFKTRGNTQKSDTVLSHIILYVLFVFIF